MADTEKITIRQVYDTVLDIKAQLLRLNGTVRGNCDDIVMLKERSGQHSVNWDRIISIGLAVMQALILAQLLVK